MPNPKHIEWLRKGVKPWNARIEIERTINLNFQPDFSKLNLHPALTGYVPAGPRGRIDLSDVDLRNANFNGAELTKIDFNHANLCDSTFHNTQLYACEFKNADFMNAHFNEVLAKYDEFHNAKFFGAVLYRSRFEQCNFANADLSFAHLVQSEFQESSIWRAKVFRTNRGVNEVLDRIEREAEEKRKDIPFGSIADLLDLRRTLKTRDPSLRLDDKTVLYFRGESSDSWDLRPAVMRSHSLNRKTKYRDRESEMLTQLITEHPGSFEGLESTFEELVMAQHFKLPTRLLDVTKNPLVGLFFACQPAFGAHGRFHVFVLPDGIRKPFNSDVVSIISNFAKLSFAEQEMLLTVSVFGRELRNEHDNELSRRYFNLDYREVMTRLRHFIAQEKPYFEDRLNIQDFFKVYVVEPKQSFPRVRAQSGAFLISAFHNRFEKTEVLKWNKDLPIYEHFTFELPSYRKDSILDDLAELNVTEESLFPELEIAANAIKSRFQ